jgi:hypothetical protein
VATTAVLPGPLGDEEERPPGTSALDAGLDQLADEGVIALHGDIPEDGGEA